MAVKSIILECIVEILNESLLLDCVGADQFVENIRNDLLSSLSYTAFEYNLLFGGDLSKIIDYLHIFGDYVQRITEILLSFEQIGRHFRQNFETNSDFIRIALNVMKNFATISSPSNTFARSKWCIAKSNFGTKLFSIIFGLYEAQFFVETMKSVIADTEHIKTSYDRCLVSNLIQFIISKPVSYLPTPCDLKKKSKFFIIVDELLCFSLMTLLLNFW